MKSLLLSLVLIVSTVLPAAAENWVDINEGGNPVVLDTDSILTDNNGNYNFWIMHSNGQIIHQANAVISCDERTIAFLSNKSFSASGRLIESYRYQNPVPTNIKIDSNGAIYYHYLCN